MSVQTSQTGCAVTITNGTPFFIGNVNGIFLLSGYSISKWIHLDTCLNFHSPDPLRKRDTTSRHLLNKSTSAAVLKRPRLMRKQLCARAPGRRRSDSS